MFQILMNAFLVPTTVIKMLTAQTHMGHSLVLAILDTLAMVLSAQVGVANQLDFILNLSDLSSGPEKC